MTHSVHPTAGGSTKYFFEVTQEIKKQGHHVTLVCTDKASNENIEVDDLLFVKQVPSRIFEYLIQTMLFGLLAFLKVRRKDFDIYCFESGYMGIWAALFKLTKKKPLVSFSMRYGWNVLRLNLRDKYLARRLGLAYILWEISFFINEVLDVRLSDKVIALSNDAKKVWIDAGITPAKIEVIPYGVNLEKYGPADKDEELLRELQLAENDNIVLYVGHLDPVRNVDKVVQAFAILSHKPRDSETDETLKLIIVGSGISEDSLKGLVNELGLMKDVKFVPHTHDETRLNKIYNLGDLMVLPQVPGTVSVQAVACGLPVVTLQNKMGLLAAVDERIVSNFVLFDSVDPEKIASTCYELLKNPEMLDNISKKGLELIVDYSWQNISKTLIEFLEEVAGRNSRSRR
jgi:glycosyltransferase involved in cell wall biosynthesis